MLWLDVLCIYCTKQTSQAKSGRVVAGEEKGRKEGRMEEGMKQSRAEQSRDEEIFAPETDGCRVLCLDGNGNVDVDVDADVDVDGGRRCGRVEAVQSQTASALTPTITDKR